MGIINMTPDSFAGDGLLQASTQVALQQAQELVAAGADIIDIGGESTRPGSTTTTPEEELQRVMPALTAIREAVSVPISIDTSKVEVAREALDAGADMINDVYALRGEGMPALAADAGVPVTIMHMQGNPKDMQKNPTYEDLISEIYDFFAERIEAAVEAGICEQQIIIDPGFGFGKTVDHNLEIVRRLREFRSLGRPILLGPSRKSTIGKVLDRPVDQRLWGTAATCAAAIMNGADIIRVHDVAQMTEVARMTDAIVRGWGEDASS
ncbi:MAG: dihydropteroate synthase [Armatimonadetes bacterium]|nr:dihydropteroate synthase [Armatimonadota bacterium]